MIRDVDIAPDYAFYTGSYHGRMAEADFMSALPDALAEVEFRIYEPKADELLDCLDSAKMAVCAVAELIANPASRRLSYSAGKVSETFEAPFSMTSEAAVVRYLGRYGVLKRGRWL